MLKRCFTYVNTQNKPFSESSCLKHIIIFSFVEIHNYDLQKKSRKRNKRNSNIQAIQFKTEQLHCFISFYSFKVSSLY